MAVLTRLDAVQVSRMAVCTSGGAMLAAQCIPGVGVVIEMGRLPRLGAMAAVAFFTVLPFVPPAAVVVLAVASDARARRFLVLGRFMTIHAFGVVVPAGQWEPGFVMVKAGFLPARLRMTIGALDTQAALVSIVLFVAGIAFQGCVPVFFAGRMTLFAHQFFVLSLEPEISLCMIERLLVELSDPGVSPFVIGMT